MSDDLTVAEWREEVLAELQYREQQMRRQPEGDGTEYWSNVANGLSEAQDIVEQVPTDRDGGDNGSDLPESFSEQASAAEGDDE